MRLFKHRQTYYIELPGGKRKSLKTKDKRLATQLFSKIKKEYLQGKIFNLEKQSAPLISEFIQQYINHPDRINLSKKTHVADSLAFRKLIDAIGDKQLNRIKTDHIAEFKEICTAQGIKPVSINTYLRHIKAGLNWAKEKEIIKEVPKIKYNKLADKLPRVIEPAAIEKILEYAKDNKPEMYRVITFALYTGCRRTEILNFRYEHIKNNIATIYGKGNKERIIPLVAPALEVIGPLQNIGKVFYYKNATTISLYFRNIVRSCGFNARFHDLRHTSATQMLKSGIKLEVVQKILGHAELRTTQIYAKVVSETLEKEMQKLSFN